MTFHLGLGRNPPTHEFTKTLFLATPDAVGVHETGPFSHAASMPAAKHVGSLSDFVYRAFASNLKVIQLVPDGSRRMITTHLRDNTDRDGKQRNDVNGCTAQEIIEMDGEHGVPLAYLGVSMLSTC